MAAEPRGQEAAEALRHRLDLGHGYVDVFRVIADLNIELYRGTFEGALDGAFLRKDRADFVFVNSNGSLTRQRMTAAHELGHAQFAVEDGEGVFEDTDGDDPEEKDAYEFARHFLMDARGVREQVAGVEDQLHRVAVVASHFVVSPAAAAIHLKLLGEVEPSFADTLIGKLRSQEVKAGDLLRCFGLSSTFTEPLSAPAMIDGAHRQRAIGAYAQGLLTFVGLADSLVLSPEETANLLVAEDLPVRDDDAPLGKEFEAELILG